MDKNVPMAVLQAITRTRKLLNNATRINGKPVPPTILLLIQYDTEIIREIVRTWAELVGLTEEDISVLRTHSFKGKITLNAKQ